MGDETENYSQHDYERLSVWKEVFSNYVLKDRRISDAAKAADEALAAFDATFSEPTK